MKIIFLLKLIGTALLIAVLVTLGTLVIQHFFGDPITDLVISLLSTSLIVLCRFLIYVFVIGGILMVLLIHWVGWDNVKFKMKRMHYRSALIAKDYYKAHKRVKYDKVMGAMARFQSRRMDADGLKFTEKSIDMPLPVAPEGQPGSEVTYEDGKMSGIVRAYHPNGTLESEVSYKDGQYHGVYKTYYADGRLHNERYYKNGKLDGVFKAWDEDGSLFFEIHYRGNKQHGPDKIFYRSGMLEFEDTYVDGKRIQRKTYDEGGKLKFIQNYH